MLDIKKKIIAVAVVCAMAVSMAACSDKKSGDSDEIQTATLTSEEAEQLKKVDLEISEYIAPTDTQQDPVEQGDNSSSDGGNGDSSANAGNGDSSSKTGNDNSASQSGVDQSSFDAEQMMSSTDLVIVPGGEESRDSSSAGGNDNSTGGENNSSVIADGGNSNNPDKNEPANDDPSVPTIKGTKKIQQAFWMNLSGNYVFDGEFITADFKIKETTADGTYPITIEWLDFSNIEAVAIKANGIDGSVVVGGEATANTFKNDGSFEVMADNVSGKPGDTVTVAFRFNKNPGICASVFRFGYDSDALEYVGGDEGADFSNALDTQNN